ncbi:unnamed protein product [Arctogadus glacialis]
MPQTLNNTSRNVLLVKLHPLLTRVRTSSPLNLYNPHNTEHHCVTLRTAESKRVPSHPQVLFIFCGEDEEDLEDQVFRCEGTWQENKPIVYEAALCRSF